MSEHDGFQLFLAVFAAIILGWLATQLIEYGADELTILGGIDRPFQTPGGAEREAFQEAGEEALQQGENPCLGVAEVEYVDCLEQFDIPASVGD